MLMWPDGIVLFPREGGREEVAREIGSRARVRQGESAGKGEMGWSFSKKIGGARLWIVCKGAAGGIGRYQSVASGLGLASVQQGHGLVGGGPG